MKFYIISGEPSGDLHAANLVAEMKNINPNIKLRAWGGERLKSEGVTLAKHINETSYMGLWNVLLNLNKIKKNIAFCKEDILKFKPDAIVLVDYPGFNLRIAKFAKEQGIKIFYYISPKVWAWNKSRVSKIKKYVDKLLVIFPFEVDFFKNNGVEATYVGNPLLDEIAKENFSFTYQTKKPIIALLPGSRKQEIEKILPKMLSVVEHYSDFQFVIAATSSFSKDYYQSFIKEKNVAIVFNQTYGLLNKAKFALVTSGTATLETALFKVPQVVCYKTNWLTYFLAKNLIKIKYLSLVNILLDKLAIKELIQGELNSKRIKEDLDKIIENNNSILTDYNKLIKLLNKEGASKNVAKIILSSI